MDERLLRFFVAVYEEKNLTRAAEKCFVSQPNISNGLKQLEVVIGKELFIRNKRGVEIKEDAHYLYPIAKRILGELNAIPEMFKDENFKPKIIIGIADSLPQYFKNDFFKKATQVLGAVEWDVRPIGHECDINLLIREWKFEEHLFLPLIKEDYVLCIPENHPLAQKNLIEIKDLSGEPFIHCPPCEAHQQSLSILNNSGLKWNSVANCQSKNEVLTLLMSGLGITFLPELFVKDWEGFKVKKHDGPTNFREIGLSYAPKSLENSKISELIDCFSKDKNIF
ncbi:DNA-binding transcriptional LysR family regulator [Wenyingzhuangia heitensis]|uniref:DNA-binding transcriptional LysR family regulator n=1 Tax=Wenyingzhuangia heitensis TaxID=1487859 RepID=A0ABX0UBV5_9FLAO|nr:LysR family transcriptional regulator [Wenyingzhuangia heitensis]NIJ46303.1 DNA-binding transcriptional LysR family regulator [Wenyingzhuangia heitensis]